ncbi:Major facilitator transporter-like protein [Mycena venus]|uniref:Major facilitator transporter-like protein n=1 Tax=Mycena venus TaxID=2733690 RepID=A0A8H7CYY7_9AGAR|nr:Major facilitator transporter-like protein [Mycena venus]
MKDQNEKISRSTLTRISIFEVMPGTIASPCGAIFDYRTALLFTTASVRAMASDLEAAKTHSPQPASQDDVPAKDPNKASSAESTILTGKRLAVIFVAVLLSVLLIALDQTILATALPRIASDFQSFTLQGWVATSFVLSQTVFLLFYGQLMRIFPTKWVLIVAIIIFEAGSLLCGVSQNIGQLIAGRTVSGVGAAGMFVAILQTVSQVTRLEDRPKFLASFGAVFGLASIIGPLIGGAFTDHVTWRWCFLINLPVGGVSLAAVTFLLKAVPPLGSDTNKRSWSDLIEQVARMDFIGATVAAGSVTSLVLALQWGGNTKPWNDKAVIISFVFAGVLAILFVAWEIYLGERAMTPTAICKSRSIYAILAYCFLNRFVLLLLTYYIPIFYQAVRHHSATKSGVDLLPFMLGLVVTIIVVGQIVGRIGFYWHFLVVAPVFLAIGSGLLHTLNTSSSSAKIAGFQILVGVGIGMGMQNALLAIQVEFKDTPRFLGQATSLATFAQLMGGTLGLGVAEPVFASELGKYLLRFAPDAPAAIVRQSPTAIYTNLPAAMISGVVRAYTESLRVVFVLGVPIAGLALLSSLFIQNIRIVKPSPPPRDGKTSLEASAK